MSLASPALPLPPPPLRPFRTPCGYQCPAPPLQNILWLFQPPQRPYCAVIAGCLPPPLGLLSRFPVSASLHPGHLHPPQWSCSMTFFPSAAPPARWSRPIPPLSNPPHSGRLPSPARTSLRPFRLGRTSAHALPPSATSGAALSRCIPPLSGTPHLDRLPSPARASLRPFRPHPPRAHLSPRPPSVRELARVAVTAHPAAFRSPAFGPLAQRRTHLLAPISASFTSDAPQPMPSFHPRARARCRNLPSRRFRVPLARAALPPPRASPSP